jgi:hypothetical protein
MLPDSLICHLPLAIGYSPRAQSPGPKPTREPNRCDLEPGKAKAREKAPFLVALLRDLPPYVVYFGPPRFALPNAPFPTRGEDTFRMRFIFAVNGVGTDQSPMSIAPLPPSPERGCDMIACLNPQIAFNSAPSS